MLLDILYKVGIALIVDVLLFIFNFKFLSRSEMKLLFNGQIITDDYNNYIKSLIGYIVENIVILAIILYINCEYTILESVFKSIFITILVPIAQTLFCLFIDLITGSRHSELLLAILLLLIILDSLCIGGMATYLLIHFNLI